MSSQHPALTWHLGFGEFRRAYVAHDDGAVAVYQLAAELVQRIIASGGDPGVNSMDTFPVLAVLGEASFGPRSH